MIYLDYGEPSSSATSASVRPCTISGAPLFDRRFMCRSDTSKQNLPAPGLVIFASDTKTQAHFPAPVLRKGLTAGSAFSTHSYLVQGTHTGFYQRVATHATPVSLPDPAWQIRASGRKPHWIPRTQDTQGAHSQLRYFHMCPVDPGHAHRTCPAHPHGLRMRMATAGRKIEKKTDL